MIRIFVILSLLGACHCISANENDRDNYREQRDNPMDCQEEKENGERNPYANAYRSNRDAMLIYWERIQE